MTSSTSPVRPRRSLLSRFSTAHGLMALSALLTFVLVVTATKGSDAHLRVAAASTDLPAGARVTREALREVEVPADGALGRATVRWDQIGVGDLVTAHPIAAGELLRPSDLVAAGVGVTQLRAMSVPVKRERAVGGTLRVGDRVDVVDVVDGTAQWIVTGAQVIAVPAPPSSRGLARDVGALYHVVVEVDADQALALAEALTHDTVSVVRSTGAPPPPAGRASLPSVPPAANAAGVPPTGAEPAAATSPSPVPGG